MTKKTSKDRAAATAPTDESTDETSSKAAEKKTRAASKDGSDDEEKPTATALTVDPSGGTSSKRPASGGSDKISPTSSGWGSVDSTPRSHGGGRDPGWGPPKSNPLEGDYVEEDYSKPNPLEGKPTKPFRDMNDDEKYAAYEAYCKERGLDEEDAPYGMWELDEEKKERRRYNRSQRGPKEKKVTQAQYWKERVNEKRKQREEEDPDAFFARRKFDLERMDHFSQKAGGPALVMSDIPYPPITSMDRKELVKWKQLRDAYEDKLKAKAARMGHDWHKTAVGWIESTDRSVLKAVCAYVWKIKREDLYEDEYQDRIMEIIGQPASKWMVTKQDMETFCIRLRLDPTGDVVSRLVNYMEQVNNLIERHGLTKQLKMPGMMKSFIKVVASRVHPSVLRQHVEDQLKVSEADTLEKFADVLKEVMERMADAELMMGPHANGGHGRQKKRSQHELIDMIVPNRRPEGGYGKPAPVVRGYVPRADLGRTEDQPGWALRAGSSGSGGRKYEKPTNKYGPSTHSKNDGERDAKKAKLVPGRDATGAVKCYACGETGHFSRDCPSKTEAERSESFKKGRNAVKRFKSKMKKANLKVQRAKAEAPSDGANWVLLNRALEVPYCPDTGADANILPRQMAEALLKAEPDVKIVDLAVPFEGEGVNDSVFKSSSYVDVNLTLQTAAGPVRIPGKSRCYIVDDGDEFLCSRDTLKSIGLDIYRLLEQVATLQMADDGDDLEEDGDVLQGQSHRSPVDAVLPGVPEPKTDLEQAIVKMIMEALDNGFPMECVQRLWSVLTKHDIWRLKFDGSDPPARVKPLKVTPKSGCVPYRCKGRKHNPLEERFLNLFAQELCDAGVIKRNQQSAWCSPVNPVMKPDGRKSLKSADQWTDEDVLKHYRLTNDYRVVNSMTEPKAGTMPFQATILQNLRGKQAMGVFDLPKCFWQFPLHPDSWDMLSFMLNGAVYTPDRVMQGHVDSALYVQATNEECYEDLMYKNMLIWIDDIFVYADNVEDYLVVLEAFMDRVDHFGFKLSPSKTKLFTHEVKWCGRIISGEGVKQDPERIEHLCAIPYPTNAGDLQQFVCAVNWLRESMVEYAQTVDPLQQRLTKALEGKAKRKRIASGIQLELSDGEKRAFDAVKAKLRASVELSHPRDDATMCLFTDASDYGWSIVVTQVVKFDEDTPIQDLKHELLVCQSGMFAGAQKAWSVIEKEAYPIARACDKLNYLLMRPTGFKMYCDHKNLIHVFAPGEEWKAHSRGKLMRWAAIIGGYRYEIMHIDGVHNLWADMMSRWGQPAPSLAARRVRIRRGHGWTKKLKGKKPATKPTTKRQPKLRPLDSEFVWPTVEEIQRAQEQFPTGRPKHAKDIDGLWHVDERLWIPSAADDLIQRIMVVAHCGSMGHRGHAALVAVVRRVFYLDHLANRASEFLRGCLLCPHVKGGRVMHRPYAPRWHAKDRNEGIHFDYLYMGEANSGAKYVLVLKDDLTHYCELIACDGPTSQVCVDALVDWTKRFGMPQVWISDQGTHFKNVAMKALAHKFKVHHDLTLAYCPWRNGTVERMNRDILQVMRVMLREYKLDTKEWDYLLPIVQSNLNQTPAASLAGKSPMELFTALRPTTPLDVVVRGVNKGLCEVKWKHKDIHESLEQLRASLRAMHKEVVDKNQQRINKAIKATEDYEQCNVCEGDYVLWSRVDENHYPKLLVTWIGPYQVTDVGEFSVKIEHLVTKEEREAHMSRVKMYAESSFNVTEEILEHVSEQGIVLKVKSIAGHKFVPDVKDFMLKVLWEGFEEIEASWEPLTKLMHECPAVVKKYVDEAKKSQDYQDLAKAMKKASDRS